MLVIQRGVYHPLTVEAKDKYGNICELTRQDISSYDVKANKVSRILTTIDGRLNPNVR